MDQHANLSSELPFGDVERIPYAAAFSETEFVRLKAGLVPISMEHKWAMHFSDMTLFFYRSWTAQPVYRVELERDCHGVKVVAAFCSSDVLKTGDADYFAMLLNFIIRSFVLGSNIAFPVPKGFEDDTSGVVQHLLAGSPYPPMQTTSKAASQWWRFWR